MLSPVRSMESFAAELSTERAFSLLPRRGLAGAGLRESSVFRIKGIPVRPPPMITVFELGEVASRKVASIPRQRR